MNKLFLLLVLFTAAAYGGGNGMRVIESTNQSITLEFTPRYDTVRTVTSGNDRYDLLTFSTSAVDEAKPGMPDTRFLTVPLALPGREGTRVEVVNADAETVEGFNLAPVPKVGAPSEKNPTGASYEPAYGGIAGFYPSEQASIVNAAPMNGWTVGYLKLYPIQYQASTRTLKKFTRLVVRITYGPRGAAQPASGDDAWAKMLPNYEQARAWKAQPLPVTRLKKAFANSARAAGQWFKLEVADDGMVRITADYLRAQGVEPSSLSSIRDIKIYGGSGRPLNEDLRSVGDADVTQCAVMYVDKNGDGKFSGDDYVLFYAQGANGWLYNPSVKQYAHSINPYTSSNYYLMQISSSAPVKEMQAAAAPASTPTVVTTSPGMVFFDEDKFNFNESGQIWVGPPMSDKLLSRVVTNKLTGYVPGTEVTYRYDLFAQSQSPSSFTIEESGVKLGDVGINPMSQAEINSSDGDYAREARDEFKAVPVLTDDRSTVRMSYVSSSSSSVGFINWLEILYQKQLVASSDELVFNSPDTFGSAEYPVSGFSTNAILGFDVTDINNVRTVNLQLQQQMGTFRFDDNLQPGSVKKYWLGASTAYKDPKSTVRLPNTNLHGVDPGADFLVITHHDFASEAQRLKAHKEGLAGGLATMIVDVDSIYNEFGNGVADPTAIRNFLLYATRNWQTPPSYVLLFGDASYDYKGLGGSDRGWVPTYETVESNNKIYSYCMDDYFAHLDSNSTDIVSLGIGRIAVRSVEEARSAVDRIIKYETSPARDPWKNTITIVADDQWVGPSDPPEYDHTIQAENLAQNFTPKSYEIRKIYIADYPTVFTPQGRRKPDARQAIIDQVNRGTLVLNFTGHGNPTQWAHENILSLEDTKTQFFNADRLTFVVAATCDWGRFDKTTYQSSAEEMMKNVNGGAIGVLSAVRAVYSTDNAALNFTFYTQALPVGASLAPRLGDAMRLTKNRPGSGERQNTFKYHLLADPTLRLAVPATGMSIDSINGIAAASPQPDTLSALERVTVKAAILGPDATVDASLNGTALVTVYDAETDKPLPDFGANFTYVQPGAVLYKGENSVVNGRVDATFIVPKDIAYQNKNGKISVYFSSGSVDGRGFTSNFIVGGTARSASADTQGPSLSVYFDTPSFKSGDLVGDQPKLIVAMSDSSGINSSGAGIGHRIEAWLDNSAKSIDLTEFYKSKRDSYQEGSVEYPMAKLDPGTHTIVVKAWDVYNNPSTAEVTFVVASGSGLSLVNVYNMPNPVSRSTTFTFEHNQLSPLDVQIKVYSVAGRLVAQIDRYAVPDRFVQIPWDCRDNDGDVLGNGVYFYRVVAKTIDGKFSSEALGKLAVMK